MPDIELAPGVILPEHALRFAFTTGAGPGGQNVNKRATRCVLRVALADLPLPPDALDRLRAAAPHLVTDAGELVISGGRERSQERNRADCLARLRELLLIAMVRPRTRRKTRPTRASKERRLAAKKRRGQIKRLRRHTE